MAVGVLLTMPKTTRKEYEKVNERIFGTVSPEAGDIPRGLIVHSAGPTPEGWYVYDIWRSKEDFQRFGTERIAPALQEVTGRDFGEQEPQYFEIERLLPVMLAV